MTSSRLSVSLLALALSHAACDGSRIANPTPAGEAPRAATTATATATDTAGAKTVPQAVFQTTPPADADGRIGGSGALTVQFNMCRSRATVPGDELRFTYDWNGDGTVDERGSCRARHTFTSSTPARVCVSDRQPDGAVCRTYTIDLTDEPTGPEHVLTLSLNDCGTVPFRYQYLNASIDPPLEAGQPYSVSLTVDGETGDGLFQASLANLGEFECGGGWQPYDIDPSPLPNDHRVSMPAAPCAARRFYVFSEVASTPLAAQLRTTVTGFHVPGRRARVEGRTSFTCP